MPNYRTDFLEELQLRFPQKVKVSSHLDPKIYFQFRQNFKRINKISFSQLLCFHNMYLEYCKRSTIQNFQLCCNIIQQKKIEMPLDSQILNLVMKQLYSDRIHNKWRMEGGLLSRKSPLLMIMLISPRRRQPRYGGGGGNAASMAGSLGNRIEAARVSQQAAARTVSSTSP